MNLRAIIVDDEELGVESLRLIISKHIESLKVVAYTTNAIEAIELIENFHPDIVFLDISMPELDGFELLNRLSWRSFSLIFTTAHQEYGLKALKQNAIDYLLKPIDPAELAMAVERARLSKLNFNEQAQIINAEVLAALNNNSKKIVIASKTAIETIALQDIIYLESKSNYTSFKLVDKKTILTPKTLKEFEEQLCDNMYFMRVHNSFIVNLNMIVRYDKTSEHIVMKDNTKISISRNKKNQFFDWLKQSLPS